MNIRQLGRRHFLLQGFATFSTTLLLNACTRNSHSAKQPTMSAENNQSKALEFISVPPGNNQTPAGLIVCLHGFGGNAQDIATLAPALNLAEYQFLFPNAPFVHPRVPEGKMWYNLDTRDYQQLAQSQQLLANWLKSLETTTGVPLSRTVLSGFSQGGAMTLDVGTTLPLAGLVSLSGYLHSTPKVTEGKAMPPVLMVHGRQDGIVPLSAAHQARDSFTALDVAVRYHEFDMGHEITPTVLELMRNFVTLALA